MNGAGKLGLVLAVLSVVAMVSCTVDGGPVPLVEEGMETYTISSSGQLSYDGNLRVGAGSFDQEKVTDAYGRTRRRKTAGLWLSVEGAPDRKLFQRVHAGQVITYEGYLIQIVEIGQGRQRPFVRVAVKLQEQPEGRLRLSLARH
jgi:hypothetical protein